MNIVKAWLKIIKTTKNAQTILASIDILAGRLHNTCGGTIAGSKCLRCKARGLKRKDWNILDPVPCPTRLIYSKRDQSKLYSDLQYQAALDAYDMGFVTRADIKRYCYCILNREGKNDRTNSRVSEKASSEN